MDVAWERKEFGVRNDNEKRRRVLEIRALAFSRVGSGNRLRNGRATTPSSKYCGIGAYHKLTKYSSSSRPPPPGSPFLLPSLYVWLCLCLRLCLCLCLLSLSLPLPLPLHLPPSLCLAFSCSSIDVLPCSSLRRSLTSIEVPFSLAGNSPPKAPMAQPSSCWQPHTAEVTVTEETSSLTSSETKELGCSDRGPVWGKSGANRKAGDWQQWVSSAWTARMPWIGCRLL